MKLSDGNFLKFLAGVVALAALAGVVTGAIFFDNSSCAPLETVIFTILYGFGGGLIFALAAFLALVAAYGYYWYSMEKILI